MSDNDQRCDKSCEVCHGMGYVRKEVPIGHPDLGRIFMCPNWRKRARLEFDGSGLAQQEYDLAWERDLLDLGMAKEAALVLQEILERGCGMVFIHGDPGLGKTLMLKIAVASWIQAHDGGAVYVNMADVIDWSREALFDDHEAGLRLARLRDVKLLALDEFDKIRETEFSSQRRFRLYDERYVQATRMESITLLASNIPPDGFDEYIYDRSRDGRMNIVSLSGRSVRPGMSWEESGPFDLGPGEPKIRRKT